MKDYTDYTDEELIGLYRGGDREVADFLMEKYKYLVRKLANRLFLVGGDGDDLIQEGMIGLFKAVRDFRPEAGSFFSFAELCVNRQMYTAVQAAARKKHSPLNSYVSLSGQEEENTALDAENRGSESRSPEQQLIEEENARLLLDQIYQVLSKMEKRVLDLYLEGLNYRQIAEIMHKPDKSIDNALQRIRSKAAQVTSRFEDL